MLLDERYLMLYERFVPPDGRGKTVEVSLEQLSGLFFCTTRNTKLIVRGLVEGGYIAWSAGRGRGNRSSMTFLLDKDKKLLELAKQYADKGEYKTAFEYLREHGGSPSVKRQFAEWMNGQFGFRSVQTENAQQDIVQLPVFYPVMTLDPGEVFYGYDAHLIKQLFDCLVQYDAHTGEVKPALAHTWKSNESATVWTFYLRKGVLFHHGREVSAEDVVFSFERLRAGGTSAWIARTIRSVQAIGPRTIVITLHQSNRLFLQFLSYLRFAILPHDLVAEDERFWSRPVGTGPFRLAEWNENRFVLESNPHYFQGRPHLDGVQLIFMPPDEFELSRGWEQLLSDQHSSEADGDEASQLSEHVLNGCSLLTWNMNKTGPQQTESFRQAVDLSLDRNKLKSELGDDQLFPAFGFYPDMAGQSNQPALDRQEARKQAIRLLHESGYRGEPVRLATLSLNEASARQIQRELAHSGIVIELELRGWGSLQEPELYQTADCFLNGIVIPDDECGLVEVLLQPGTLLGERLHPELLGWIRQQTDTILASESTERRKHIFAGIETRLKEESYIHFLWHKKQRTYYNRNIRGVCFDSLGMLEFKELWMESRY